MGFPFARLIDSSRAGPYDTHVAFISPLPGPKFAPRLRVGDHVFIPHDQGRTELPTSSGRFVSGAARWLNRSIPTMPPRRGYRKRRLSPPKHLHVEGNPPMPLDKSPAMPPLGCGSSENFEVAGITPTAIALTCTNYSFLRTGIKIRLVLICLDCARSS